LLEEGDHDEEGGTQGDHDEEGGTQGDHDVHTMSSTKKQGQCISVRVHIVP
jgi:hypothetical protein